MYMSLNEENITLDRIQGIMSEIMQEKLQEELSKPAYQEIYSGLEKIEEEYKQSMEQGLIISSETYQEYIKLLKSIREYEKQVFFKEFGLIY